MKLLACLLPAIASLFTVSCSSHLAAPSPVVESAYGEATRASSSRVLIKTGTMQVRVSDVQQASADAKALVKKHRGYLESIDSSDDGDAYADLNVRVPKTELVSVMDGLATLGTVTSRHVQVKDVTDEWIDLQAKLNNMRAMRDRLRSLLQQAKTVKETLEVEKELTRVQSELDSLEGKIKAMQQHVSYSKLTVRIRQKNIPGPLGAVGKGAWWGVKKLFVIK